MEASLEWVKVILSFLGPIMVVWVGAKMEKDRKSGELVAKRNMAEREQKDAEIKRMFAELEAKVDRIDRDLGSVKGTVEEMQRLDAGMRSDLAVLGKYHEYNVKHIQRMGMVVITLAEGLRDKHIDGNVTRSVDGLKQFESNMYSDLLGRAPLSTSANISTDTQT